MAKLKRPIKVKDLIVDSLCELIQDGKRYSDISIQDIVDKAGVCRNSFYRNYTTIDDILMYRFNGICNEQDKQDIVEKEYYEMVYGICDVCKKNKDFLHCFYQANAMMYIQNLTARIIKSNYQYTKNAISTEEYYTYVSKAWVATGLLTEWIERGCDLSVEEFAKIITEKTSK